MRSVSLNPLVWTGCYENQFPWCDWNFFSPSHFSWLVVVVASQIVVVVTPFSFVPKSAYRYLSHHHRDIGRDLEKFSPRFRPAESDGIKVGKILKTTCLPTVLIWITADWFAGLAGWGFFFGCPADSFARCPTLVLGEESEANEFDRWWNCTSLVATCVTMVGCVAPLFINSRENLIN